jgi:hypothetical protein
VSPSGGVTTFIDLTDTPANYTAASGILVRVNDTEDGLVFSNIISGDLYTVAWTDYSDDSTLVGWASFTEKIIEYKKVGKLVFVNFRITGTSNNMVTTFTVPYPEGQTGNPIFMFRAHSGSNIDAAYGEFIDASTVKLYATIAGTIWNSAAVIKNAHGQFWYQTT